MKNMENRIIVGKFGACYGIRGWIRVFSFTEDPESLFSYQPWYICRNNQWQKVELEGIRTHNQDVVVKLIGVGDRNVANALTNYEIAIDSKLLPALQRGDFYWKDLIGCRVLTRQNYDLGIVADLMETGSNDVLIIKANLNDVFNMKERLIPFVDKQVIKMIDLNTKQIIVEWDPAF